jgi:hypothetical protein
MTGRIQLGLSGIGGALSGRGHAEVPAGSAGCGAVELSLRRFDGVGGEVGGATFVAEPGVAVG